MGAPSDKRMDRVTNELLGVIRAAQTNPDRGEAQDASTKLVIRASINYLRQLAKVGAPVWGYWKENIEAINKLKEQIAELKKTLRTMPNAARLLLFTPEESGAADHLPTTATQKKSMERVKRVVGMLNYLDARCSQIMTNRPGKHRAIEHLKHYCAEEAWRLMRGCGLTPASGIETSVIGKIARLLYEAVTGKRNVDLAHECRVVVERGKAGDISIDGPTVGHGRLSSEGPLSTALDEDEFISGEDETHVRQKPSHS